MIMSRKEKPQNGKWGKKFLLLKTNPTSRYACSWVFFGCQRQKYRRKSGLEKERRKLNTCNIESFFLTFSNLTLALKTSVFACSALPHRTIVCNFPDYCVYFQSFSLCDRITVTAIMLFYASFVRTLLPYSLIICASRGENNTLRGNHLKL